VTSTLVVILQSPQMSATVAVTFTRGPSGVAAVMTIWRPQSGEMLGFAGVAPLQDNYTNTD
jgi:hypothetical protein